MTSSEFRTWLDGFSAAIGDAPTPEQWQAVKDKLATVREERVVPSISPAPVLGPMLPYRPTTGDLPPLMPTWTVSRTGSATAPNMKTLTLS